MSEDFRGDFLTHTVQ